MERPAVGGVILPFKPSTHPEKLTIIRRVADKLSAQQPGLRPKVFEFTGLMPNVINKLADSSAETEIYVKVIEIDRSAVYNQLVNFYLEEKVMPSTYDLFISLEDNLPNYMDIGEFRNYLLKNGFMWKQIVKGSFVVIEKPEVIYERYLYLKNIQWHRKETRPIYFIGENVFDTKGNLLPLKQSKFRNSESLIRMIYAVSDDGLQFQEYVKKFNTTYFMDWIKNKLLISLQEPSVIVLNNYKHHCEEVITAPSVYSNKKEICDWLDYFNVPYEPEMAKSMLYELVHKYTDVKQKQYVVDNFLKSHGHTVLRIPDCINKLTPAAYFIEILRKNLPHLVTQRKSDKDKAPGVQVMIEIVISNLNKDTEDFKTFLESVFNEEKEIIRKDNAVDAEIDNLERTMQMCPLGNMAFDSDLPSNDSETD